ARIPDRIEAVVPRLEDRRLTEFRAAGHTLRGISDRVVAVVVARGVEVASEIDLDRGLAVAEQIVGRADARRDVVVADDAGSLRKHDRIGKEARGPDDLLGRIAPGVVVAKRALECHAPARPLLLHVE